MKTLEFLLSVFEFSDVILFMVNDALQN
jgi:hypothetical protein